MIWIIGERSSPSGRRSSADTQGRLAALFGVDRDAMMSVVLWLNLFEYEGTDPELYVRLVEEGADYDDAILLLGRRVQSAFGLDDLKPLATVARSAGRGPLIMIVPHPSGVNRWWNDPDNCADAAIALRAVWGGHSR